MLTHQPIGLAHIGIPTADLDMSIDFYKSLGFEIVTRAAFNGVIMVMLYSHGVTFELIQAVDDPESATSWRNEGHVDHIALRARDIDKTFEEIEQMGLKVIEGLTTIPVWENGSRYFVVEGPSKEHIEFLQIL